MGDWGLHQVYHYHAVEEGEVEEEQHAVEEEEEEVEGYECEEEAD